MIFKFCMFHNWIPPLDTFGDTLIFFVFIAVCLKILLSFFDDTFLLCFIFNFLLFTYWVIYCILPVKITIITISYNHFYTSVLISFITCCIRASCIALRSSGVKSVCILRVYSLDCAAFCRLRFIDSNSSGSTSCNILS